MNTSRISSSRKSSNTEGFRVHDVGSSSNKKYSQPLDSRKTSNMKANAADDFDNL